MKIITIGKDSADLDITLDELIVIRNSLNTMLSKVNLNDLHAKTSFFPREMEAILASIEQIIETLQ